MKKMMKIQWAGALALMLGAVGSQAETHYSPAMFDFSGDTLVTRLGATPALSSGSAVLYCQAVITANGAVESAQCYDKAGDSALVSKTELALGALPFKAATVDDKAVPVRMSFRVAYVAKQAGMDAVLIPNLGSMQAHYGRDYIEPQERLDVANWYQRYAEESWVNGEPFLGDGAMSRVAATVTENGQAETVRTLDVERAYKRDSNLVKNAVKRSRFIPGFVDGKAVPMGYLAVVNYPDSGEAVSAR